jgi:dimethylhistidine N-methyltransferase
MHRTRASARFADDVRAGLLAAPKRLHPMYFYDALGSQLFEAICRLPWYPLMRAESALLARHAAEMVGALGDGATLVELGCGSGEKLARLCEPLCRRSALVRVHLVDVSEAALDLSTRTLSRLGRIDITAHQATYEEGLTRAAARRAPATQVLVVFLGSNLGNLDPDAAVALLSAVRCALRHGDALLLGADLAKPEAELLRAYDDPLGVTAAFNKNLLVRINRELGGDFDLDAFDHQARWNAAAGRVEMHLVSRRAQEVRVEAAGIEVRFAAGESIWTESSYKYTPEGIDAMARRAGLRCRAQWLEPRHRFSTSLLAVET